MAPLVSADGDEDDADNDADDARQSMQIVDSSGVVDLQSLVATRLVKKWIERWCVKRWWMKKQ